MKSSQSNSTSKTPNKVAAQQSKPVSESDAKHDEQLLLYRKSYGMSAL